MIPKPGNVNRSFLRDFRVSIAGLVGKMLFQASDLILTAKLSGMLTVPGPHYCMDIVGRQSVVHMVVQIAKRI